MAGCSIDDIQNMCDNIKNTCSITNIKNKLIAASEYFEHAPNSSFVIITDPNAVNNAGLADQVDVVYYETYRVDTVYYKVTCNPIR